MNAILTAARRRPWWAVALLLALAWIGVVAYETLAHPLTAGIWYFQVSDIVYGSYPGVAAIAGLCWLVERSRVFGAGA